jgi:hypothetical protein
MTFAVSRSTRARKQVPLRKQTEKIVIVRSRGCQPVISRSLNSHSFRRIT